MNRYPRCGQCLQVAGTSRIVVQGNPNLPDAVVQALIEVDPCVAPDRVPQLRARDHFACPFDEQRQHTCRLRLKSDGFAMFREGAADGVEGEWSKSDDGRGAHVLRDEVDPAAVRSLNHGLAKIGEEI